MPSRTSAPRSFSLASEPQEPPVETDGKGVLRKPPRRLAVRPPRRADPSGPPLRGDGQPLQLRLPRDLRPVRDARARSVAGDARPRSLGAGAVGGILGALVATRGSSSGSGSGGPHSSSGRCSSRRRSCWCRSRPARSSSIGSDARRRRVLLRVGVMIFDVSAASMTFLRTPDRIRARTAGTFRFVNYGIRPIGALLGGALGTALGLQTTLWIGVLGALLGVVSLVFSPIPQAARGPGGGRLDGHERPPDRPDPRAARGGDDFDERRADDLGRSALVRADDDRFGDPDERRDRRSRRSGSRLLGSSASGC